jgi:hypothetical protein
MYLTNKPLKVKQIYSMEIWTDAFINNANIMIDRHHLLAGYSLSYMSIAIVFKQTIGFETFFFLN